jgi:two-component system, NtrC family, sensor kinase
MIISYAPVILVDVIGSILMIYIAFACIRQMALLKARDSSNVIWTYLYWVCFALAGFATSRSAGHLLKQVLLLAEYPKVWEFIRPLSGSINTVMLVAVGSVTLYFERSWKIYEQILLDKQAIEAAQNQIKDLKQRKIMELQLSQADKLESIARFSSGIAHEINNPLGIILGYTQLLLRGEDPLSEKYQDLKTIEKHVRTCKSIVEDLLNFARNSRPSQDAVRLNKVLEDVVLFIQQHSELEKVEIIRDYDQSLPPMHLDEKKIRQAIFNLIMNARHAVGQKGTIGISTQYCPDGKQVIIEVRDTGHGIEQKNLSCIFDPFFTTKPTGEGTGLGLSVSYGIIKNHGGNISVQSDPGKGAKFTVVLPTKTQPQ